MARRNSNATGTGKLLDAWEPPPDAGQPIGCVATTFTFSPEFFEEECLGRFVDLATDPKEDGSAYLVEREEKFSQLVCKAALVDQHNCKGARSLRWDLLAVRPPRGLLHAKVSLLQWSELVRLIVASANLTEDGYRKNREIFGVIDYRGDGEAPLECLNDMVAFLRQVLDLTEGAAANPGPARQRCSEFLDGVLRAVRRWSITESNDRRRGMRVFPVLVAPKGPSALNTLTKLWPSGRPWLAKVVSPFFDPPEAANQPAISLWQSLRQRGGALVEFWVEAEDIQNSQALEVHAPASLMQATPTGRSSVSADLYRLQAEPGRPLHAKSIWFAGESWAAYMIGSSNFTTAGLGLGRQSNLEANLVYVAPGSEEYSALQSCFPKGKQIDPGTELHWQPPADPMDDSANATIAVLPRQFGVATYDSDEGERAFIRLTFVTSEGPPPAGWLLCPDDTGDVFYTEEKWRAERSPTEVTLPWPVALPPCGFTVRWSGSPTPAWWPVNLVKEASLPRPAQLRGLTLDALIGLLTSARPLYESDSNRRRGAWPGDRKPEEDLNPLKRVDCSAFLLQRTRRVSDGLTALRNRLEKPAYTRQTLDWRIDGPIGVRALAAAMAKEARSPDEKAFLLVELAMELSRVNPRTAPGCLPAAAIKTELAKVIAEIRSEVAGTDTQGVGNLRDYIQDVFERVGP